MQGILTSIKSDFPIFSQDWREKGLVFLDSAASTQKPEPVIEALAHYYRTSHANIHRGVYDLSMKATDLHDQAREKVQAFLGAAFSEEIIFTRGAKEGINLVANSPDR